MLNYFKRIPSTIATRKRGREEGNNIGLNDSNINDTHTGNNYSNTVDNNDTGTDISHMMQ